MRKLIGLALCGLLVAGMAACGSRSAEPLSADAARAAGVVLSFDIHLARGESEAACRLLTDRAKRQLARSLALPDLGRDPQGGCLMAAQLATDSWSAAERRAIPRIRIRRVDVDVDQATVPIDAVEFPKELEHLRADGEHPNRLVRVDGRWLLDDLG
jgi:hypothetical protein